MSQEEEPKKKPSLEFKIGPEDSALIVRTDGHIELVSREIQDNGDDNYLGDLEDLNKTFTLVLAFAAALENENLYQHIFHNLNNVLHRQWRNLPPDEKARIKEIRLNHLLDEQEREEIDPETKQEWMNKWRDEIEKGRQQLEDYMKGARDEDSFPPEARPFDEMETRKKRKKKVNPLSLMKNIEWHPYDETLKANMKSDWRLDQPPPEEN